MSAVKEGSAVGLLAAILAHLASSSPDRRILTGQSLRARRCWAGAAELDAMPLRTIATSAIVRMDMSQVNELTTSKQAQTSLFGGGWVEGRQGCFSKER